MMRGLLQRLHAWLERRAEHPSAPVRRTAQFLLLALPFVRREGSSSDASPRAFIERLLSSHRMQQYLARGRGPRYWIAVVARIVSLKASVNAKVRELNSSDHYAFVLRIDGAIDQVVLRNLVIWHNHLLDCANTADGRLVDILFVLPSPTDDEARLSDLISTALMMERIRNCSIFWTIKALPSAVPSFLSAAAQARVLDVQHANDLRQLSAEATAEVEFGGTANGIKLLLDGRKRAQDFLKAALPGQFIVAVALREGQDGDAAPDELDFWLPLFEAMAARYSHVSFVILNRIAPSRCREWPPRTRFARHQGLSWQDAMCLAQIADGFVGVMDAFGLAANGASRPGVYVSLTQHEGSDEPKPAANNSTQLMIPSGQRGHIEAGVARFLSVAQH